MKGVLVIWTSLWLYGFKLQAIFDTAPAASKNNPCFKSGHK